MVVKQYFPYARPRDGQMEVIQEIQQAIDDNGYNDIILDAPTGFGKSAVARTICNYYADYWDNTSYIMTATKMLQHQYLKECSEEKRVNYAVALGRGNYLCKSNYNNCNDGDCKIKAAGEKIDCPFKMKNNDPCQNGGCEYWVAKCQAINSDVAIMNYNVLMADNQYVGHYNDRFLMICDEAHNIESKVMNEVNIIISNRILKKLGMELEDREFKINDLDYWISYIKTMIDNCEMRIEYCDDYGLIQKDVEYLDGLMKNLIWKVQELQYHNDWIICPNPFQHKVEIKPLKISNWTHSKLLGSTSKHIFMSGTFIDSRQFCKDIGIDADDVYYVTAKSSFDMKNNNKIFKRFAGNLAYKSKAKTLPRTLPILKSIFAEHQGECGLIHCNSKNFADYIMDYLDDDRLMTYYSDDKDYQIKRFSESEDKIMGSYSLQEGIDLPGDKIRFQVFYKVPYPSLADNQVKERLDVDPNWYNVKTVQTILQSWGRGMRFEDDYCTNYLIDTGFNRVLNDEKFKNLIPNEFREAIQ